MNPLRVAAPARWLWTLLPRAPGVSPHPADPRRCTLARWHGDGKVAHPPCRVPTDPTAKAAKAKDIPIIIQSFQVPSESVLYL